MESLAVDGVLHGTHLVHEQPDFATGLELIGFQRQCQLNPHRAQSYQGVPIDGVFLMEPFAIAEGEVPVPGSEGFILGERTVFGTHRTKRACIATDKNNKLQVKPTDFLAVGAMQNKILASCGDVAIGIQIDCEIRLRRFPPQTPRWRSREVL